MLTREISENFNLDSLQHLSTKATICYINEYPNFAIYQHMVNLFFSSANKWLIKAHKLELRSCVGLPREKHLGGEASDNIKLLFSSSALASTDIQSCLFKVIVRPLYNIRIEY